MSQSRTFKQSLRAFARRHGLHLFTNGSLPVGVNWLRDIARLTPAAKMPALIFDVGANVGEISREMHAVFPNAIIHSFEPIAATCARLRANTVGIPQIKVWQLALGAQAGTARIFLQPESEFDSLAPCAKNSSGSSAESESVQIETVDALCAAHEIAAIDIIKTDTEGYDLEVLRGAERMLTAGRVRWIYSEVTFACDNVQNTAFFPLHEHLTARGFRFLGLADQFFMHHNPEAKTFCNALFMRRG